jgi:hypothetical protein
LYQISEKLEIKGLAFQEPDKFLLKPGQGVPKLRFGFFHDIDYRTYLCIVQLFVPGGRVSIVWADQCSLDMVLTWKA